VEKRMYVSPVEQYQRGIAIPVHAVKVCFVVDVMYMTHCCDNMLSEQTKRSRASDTDVVEMGPQDVQGVEGNEVKNHVSNFALQSLRLCELVNKLFE
jgi:hypothetical protein